MENNTGHKDTKILEEHINQLTDENQRYFLGVLEALNFAQNMEEILPFKSPGAAQQ
jgi:hypothetical protein